MIDLPCMIVVERMYSIINAKTYEEWFSWTFIIILCGCTWSSPVLIMLNMFYFPSVFPLIYTYLIFDVVLIALYALYFFAYFFTGNKSLIGLPLSERYQRTENKTAYHTMLKFAITMAFIVAFSSSYVVLSLIVPYYFNNVNMHDKEAFIRYINDILVDCCILILPYHFVHVHPSLVKRYRNVLHMTLFRCFRGSVNTECPHVIQVKSTAGHNLTLPDESNYYFKALADQWDVNIYSNSRRLFFPEFLLPKLVGDIVHAVREVTNSGMIVVPSMIVIERLHSVIYAKTYEKYFSWVFIILVCGSIWLFVIWIMIDLFYLDKYLPIIYTYTFSNLFLITVYTIYFLTYFITTNKSIIGLKAPSHWNRRCPAGRDSWHIVESEAGVHCYDFAPLPSPLTKKSFNNNICKQLHPHAKLASFHNDVQVGGIHNVADINKVIVGLFNEYKAIRWADGTPVNKSFLALNEPVPSSDDIVHFKVHRVPTACIPCRGYTYDRPLLVTKPMSQVPSDMQVACKVEAEPLLDCTPLPDVNPLASLDNTECEPGWSKQRLCGNVYCYIETDIPSSHQDFENAVSRDWCNATYPLTGAHLASVHCVEEHYYIQSFTAQNLIGLHIPEKLQNNGTFDVRDFRWTDGSPVGFVGWNRFSTHRRISSEIKQEPLFKDSLISGTIGYVAYNRHDDDISGWTNVDYGFRRAICKRKAKSKTVNS
uniref:G protein-coupled receptor n=1 Tax=Panagrellus redivivus TaxID=6233 RepID=A0A7E4ZXW1_PANRE